MVIVIVMDEIEGHNNGTTVSAKRFAEALEKRGHEVRIVTTGKEANNRYIVKEWKHNIVDYFASKQGIKLGQPEKDVLEKAFDGADVVHFIMPLKLSIGGKKVADKMKIPSTTAFHIQPENITFAIGANNKKMVVELVYYILNKIFYKNFDYIHCPSKFITDELKKRNYNANLYTISNGVDKSFIKQNFIKEDEFKDKFVILMIGRYSHEKRQNILIDAIAKSKHSDKIQLILAGSGPAENEYRQLAKEKLKNDTIFGFYTKEQLIKVINNCDLYVHSSEIEIEAISCIEAFACGLVPIIADSDKSATRQFAIDERSLFKVNDSDDLANKIDYYIEHEDERKKMSSKYIEQAEDYRIEKSIEKIEEMFKDAIKTYKRK